MLCNFPVAIFMLAIEFPALQSQSTPTPELPPVALAEFPPVVQEQVQEAYQAVRANPRDPEANGRLGMLLDLCKRREFAQVWYVRAHQLDPKAFRWLYYLGSLESALGKRAEALGQTEILRSIDKDLQRLEAATPR